MNPSTPRNPDALTVARAILSTLDAPSAVFALVTVATFARAIVAAAALLRQCSGDAAEATARAVMLCAGGHQVAVKALRDAATAPIGDDENPF